VTERERSSCGDVQLVLFADRDDAVTSERDGAVLDDQPPVEHPVCGDEQVSPFRFATPRSLRLPRA
jgi:hypothetical protein